MTLDVPVGFMPNIPGYISVYYAFQYLRLTLYGDSDRIRPLKAHLGSHYLHASV